LKAPTAYAIVKTAAIEICWAYNRQYMAAMLCSIP
jgi:hypothetical protein